MFFQYFYSLTSAVFIFGFIALITSPFLAMVALLVVAAGVVAALAWATLALSRALGRSVIRAEGERGERRRLRAATVGVNPGPYARVAVRSIATSTSQLQRSSESLSAGGVDGGSVPRELRQDRFS